MFFSPFERLVAFRYLRAKRSEGFISVIAGFSLVGITLGVATLIIVMAVMNGFRQELMGRILGLNGHLGVYPIEGSMSGYEPLAERISGVPGVVQVTPTVEGQAMSSGEAGNASGVIVRGMSVDQIRHRRIIAENIVGGSLDDFSGTSSALIGRRLAYKLGISVGDQITLISPKGRVTALGSVPRVRSYRVVATYEIGMFEYDSGFVYLPLEAAQTYFQTGEGITQLEVMLDDPDRVGAARIAIQNAVDRPLRLLDWQQANASFFNAIKVERNVMFLILTLIILVAAFNVIATLIMLVKDKSRDIAILRTMGATRGMVMRIFFLSGASIGVFGTFLGCVLGLTFSLNIETIRRWIETLSGADLFAAEIYFLSQLPAEVDPTEVGIVVGLALGLSFLATLYPSWRAARLDPVECLRNE
ncbi:MAG: lipoprotein-releasing ABC transporter permease subunit [Acetobacterales bacterium]